MDSIFFERQEAALCAQHALNMLLQDDLFKASDLAEIAHRLDAQENIVLEPGSQHTRSVNMNDSGFFSVQVLAEALKTFSLELVSINHPSMKELKADPTKAKAFICNQSEHWFTVRKFGQQWFVLNSVKKGPELISDTYMGLYFHQLTEQGYSIFAVVGILPHCTADEIISRNPVLPPAAPSKSDKKLGVMEGIGRKLGSLVDDISNKMLGPPTDYESDYEKAIRLSLADDIGIVPSVSASREQRELEEAIRLSIGGSPTVAPTYPHDSDVEAALRASLDPSNNVQVRNIPIQQVGESEADVLRRQRQAFLDRLK